VVYPPYFTDGTCTTDGQTLSITSGGGQTLTVSFQGVSNIPINATVALTAVDLGVIQTTLSGPGTFYFRDVEFPYWFPGQFGLSINFQTGVSIPTRQILYHTELPNTNTAVGSLPYGCCQYGPNNALDGFSLVFSSVQSEKLVAGGSAAITANYALFAPEPSSIVLMATGFLAIGGVAVSRKRRTAPVVADARSST
jgi:hypothetical protein